MKVAEPLQKGPSKTAKVAKGSKYQKVHVDFGYTWCDLFFHAFPAWTEEELRKKWTNFRIYTTEDLKYVLMCGLTHGQSPDGSPEGHGKRFWLSVGDDSKIVEVIIRGKNPANRYVTTKGTVYFLKLCNSACIAMLQTRREGTHMEKVAVRHELFDETSMHWVGNWKDEFTEKDRETIKKGLDYLHDHVIA